MTSHTDSQQEPEPMSSEQPEEPSAEALTKALVDVAVESWRFCRRFDQVLLKLDAGEQRRYRGQSRWFLKKVEESLGDLGMRIVNVEGKAYDAGMAATPMNIEEFRADDALVVDRMLEPIIMGPDGVVRPGTVTLRRTAS